MDASVATGRELRELRAQCARLAARVAALEAELRAARHAATHDPLTGLLNRAGLIEAWPQRPSGALLALIDLDRFKEVNDTYGHAAGDALLVALAAWVQQAPAAARLGGDEFAVVLDGDPALLPAAVSAHLPGGQVITAQLSVGLTPAVGPLEDALERADAAMYVAKRRGGGREMYTPPPGGVVGGRSERPRVRRRDLPAT